ncbi:hypothetical protein CXQ80_20440 [Pseudomonas sp. 02C 26]|nr:hypothetical protein CXQ80_20440 [Pseudomonas sp. 02C 26]
MKKPGVIEPMGKLWQISKGRLPDIFRGHGAGLVQTNNAQWHGMNSFDWTDALGEYPKLLDIPQAFGLLC